MLALLYIETQSAHLTKGLAAALEVIHKSFPVTLMSGVYLLKSRQSLCMVVGTECSHSLSHSKELFPQLLKKIKNIETPTDVSLLAYGEEISAAPYLAVPHPRLIESGHILSLASEIAPDFIHPILKKSLYEIIKEADVDDWGVFHCRGKSLLPDMAGKTNVIES